MESDDPIHPDEIILRRVPKAYMVFDPVLPAIAAFSPHKERDTDGLSVYRERYHSAEDVAKFRGGLGTEPSWVVRVRASSIFDLGLTLRPDPRPAEHGLPARAGHALITEINSESRKSPELQVWKQKLIDAVISVEGGSDGFPPPVT